MAERGREEEESSCGGTVVAVVVIVVVVVMVVVVRWCDGVWDGDGRTSVRGVSSSHRGRRTGDPFPTTAPGFIPAVQSPPTMQRGPTAALVASGRGAYRARSMHAMAPPADRCARFAQQPPAPRRWGAPHFPSRRVQNKTVSRARGGKENQPTPRAPLPDLDQTLPNNRGRDAPRPASKRQAGVASADTRRRVQVGRRGRRQP